MRYQQGQPIPDQIQPMLTDDSFLFAAVLGLFIAIILTYLAKKGRQTWLLMWGIGLIAVSLTYLGFILAT